MVLWPWIWNKLTWISFRWYWYSMLSSNNYLLYWGKSFLSTLASVPWIMRLLMLAGGDMGYSQSYISPNSSFRQFCAYRICSLSLKKHWPLHDSQCIMSCILSSFRWLCRTMSSRLTAQVSPNKLWRDQSVSKKFKYDPQQISIIFARIKKNYPSSNFFQPWWTNGALELCFSMHTSSLEPPFAKTRFRELPRILTLYILHSRISLCSDRLLLPLLQLENSL